MEGHRIAHGAISNYLRRNGCHDTLAAFERETKSAGWSASASTSDNMSSQPTLEDLVELYQSNTAAQETISSAIAGSEQKGPTDLVLPGPSTLPFRVTKTYDTLHAGNILSLTSIDLPTRSFSTSSVAYETSVRKVLCSSASDKNIVLSDPATGEMIELLEGGSGDGHTAAVLCVAQNPDRALSRELVSCGMDGKVVVWDLLHRKPVQTLRDHAKFVVRCVFSPRGDYLATCSYDKTVRLYQRNGTRDTRWLERPDDDAEDDSDMPALIDTRFELKHTITTQHNPESIVFVRGPVAPNTDDPGKPYEVMTATRAEISSTPLMPQSAAQRTWLAYTTRSDCCVHYVALPLDEEARSTSTDGVDALASTLNESSLSDGDGGEAPPAWSELAFNTNVNRLDVHVSYSLLHLSVHPLGKHIAIQTGDHSIPTSGYAPASSAMSRILLMPILSSQRTTTLWTGVASSGYATNRHAWLRDGSAAWLTSEEGVLRLIDTKGKIRAVVSAHGAAAVASGASPASANDAMRTTASWSRGGNTIIKDVVVLDDEGSVASCGFDRTIRLVAQTTP